jgi:3-phosphoshikimate 1-carboxyvinyltransferase
MVGFSPNVPGSRSIAARAVVCAALAGGTSALSNVPDCDDTAAMLDCIAGCGAQVVTTGSACEITSAAPFPHPGRALNCGASGTTMRFVCALSALTDEPMILVGTERLLERPMAGLSAALRTLGKSVDESHRRRVITGAPHLRPEIVVDARTSGQFASGLLMALAAAGTPSLLRAAAPASVPFISMTVAVMRAFGADISAGRDGPDLLFTLEGTGYRPSHFSVEPDVMSANYFLAAAVLTDTPVFVPGVRPDTVQGDVALFPALRQMGGALEWTGAGVRCRRARGAALTGCSADIRAMPDMALTLAALGAAAQGPTTLSGIGILRYKESDRLAVLRTELGKLGAATRIDDDGDALTILPAPSLRPAEIETYDDHRVAMAFGLLTLIEPRITIRNPECVAKTWPAFFAELRKYASFACTA